ncbi:MAG: hypothetical protein V7746_02820 [Halioglobus sp.]
MMTAHFNEIQKTITVAFRSLFSVHRLATISITLVISGCISLAEIQENEQYPRDTAISIDGRYYTINTYKCSEVRNINDKGVLDCYAEDGSRSAQVTPESQFQIKMFNSYFDYDWGSEEHHAFLYNFYYLGGKEQIVNNATQSANAIFQITQLMNSSTYDAGRPAVGAPYYGTNPALSGMSVLGAREFTRADWHFNNIDYFSVTNGLTYSNGGISSVRIGNVTRHSNGIRSFHSGDSIYHSNGTATIKVTDRINYTNDGTHCIKLTSSITRCQKK